MKKLAFSLLLAAEALTTGSSAVATVQPGPDHHQSARGRPLASETPATRSREAKGSSNAIPAHAAGTAESPPITPIPPITDADREAAFPEVKKLVLRDNAVNSFILFDQLESPGGNALFWSSTGWIGRDLNRLWFRSKGDLGVGSLGDVEAHLLYGRRISRWWDIVIGLRQDLGPAPLDSWLAVGIQGLAPYWFDVTGTAYLGTQGQMLAQLEVEYELLLTNRLVLQPLIELHLHRGGHRAHRRNGTGRWHLARNQGSTGMSGGSVDAGLRLRYEIRREVAPYLGIIWSGAFSDTADTVHTTGRGLRPLQVVAGVRLWY
jgi:copper resistance protein B